MIDWDAFRPLVGEIYNNRSDRGGRPNIDEVVMVTLLVLAPSSSGTDSLIQNWEADRGSTILQVVSRISGEYPGFYDSLVFKGTTGKDRYGSGDLGGTPTTTRFFRAHRKTRRRPGRDFIIAEPGMRRLIDTPRGEDATTRRSTEGSWTKKGHKFYFGYELRSNVDTDLGLIRDSNRPPQRSTTAR
jgi:IS5 family transposase